MIEQYLSQDLVLELEKCYASGYRKDELEEIRIRVGQPVEWVFSTGIIRGEKSIREWDVAEVMNYLTDYSWYAFSDEIRRGYFTIKGGNRVGVSGRTGCVGDRVENISDVGMINIRVAHQKIGCASEIMECIRNEDRIFNTLFVSLPGRGKTTYLRDCIRILSSGLDGKLGLKVGVVDERSEIGASYNGIPQNDLGKRTDILDDCPKQHGMRMLLRSMSPDIIAVDELSDKKDFEALEDIIASGINIIGTIHGNSVEDVRKKISKFQIGNKIDRYIYIDIDESGKRKLLVYGRKGEIIA